MFIYTFFVKGRSQDLSTSLECLVGVQQRVLAVGAPLHQLTALLK